MPNVNKHIETYNIQNPDLNGGRRSEAPEIAEPPMAEAEEDRGEREPRELAKRCGLLSQRRNRDAR